MVYIYKRKNINDWNDSFYFFEKTICWRLRDEYIKELNKDVYQTVETNSTNRQNTMLCIGMNNQPILKSQERTGNSSVSSSTELVRQPKHPKDTFVP